jgi:4-alpha-glucanotransferase
LHFSRSSGILLHPTSLPGNFGIGDFGGEARAFVDFLAASGQKLWQVLPLGPTGPDGSPYNSYSAFAGNTLLISPQQLVEEGFLTKSSPEPIPSCDVDRVDFGLVQSFKDQVLHKAYAEFRQTNNHQHRYDFEQFSYEHSAWLEDYALFCALKDSYGRRVWTSWDAPLARRDRAALVKARNVLRDQIEAQKFYQFIFFSQWRELRAYCNRSGVQIIGDIPIFVAHDSADVWTNPEQFKVDLLGQQTAVAGVPPDYYSATGQIWGNPLYNWDRMKDDGFKFWISRVHASLQLTEIVRIDHFRGFAACWEIPAGDKSATGGRWVETPGKELFSALGLALGELPIIAEDLGEITPDVTALLEALGFPGMRVMQFGFRGDSDDPHLPHNYPANVVAYTATHDSNTTVGWFNQTGDDEKDFCLRYLHTDGHEINWAFVNASFGSAADTAIVPLQDVLGLGSEARMNVPNSSAGNWAWRYRSGLLVDEIGMRLKQLTERHRR